MKGAWRVALQIALGACVVGVWSGCADDDDGRGQRPQPVACSVDRDCPDTMLCESNVCDKVACPDIYAPVCDDQGETWPNRCEARMARATVVAEGACVAACEGPNPQGCQPGTCPSGQRCVAPPGDGSVCVPSSCFCGDEGQWICTDDCGGSICVPEDPTPTPCATPNPQGCDPEDASTCGVDEVCTEPPGDGTICLPSSCFCGDDGHWICTEDCGGWFCDAGTTPTCEGPNPEGCVAAGCPSGEVCTLLEDRCVPSGCFCSESGWACTDDCSGGTCVPELSCLAPHPAGCTQDGCAEGFRCDRSEVVCAPSYCGCDEDSNSWVCSRDCGGGGVCVADDSASSCGPNPAGCTQEGCAEGFFCDRSDVDCAPSYCGCDEEAGQWLCTRDCGGGGTCRPIFPGECNRDRDCAVGQFCVRGSCETGVCTMDYNPVCGVDGRTYSNACFARLAHVAIAHHGPCARPGDGCDGPNPAGCTQEGCARGEVCDRSEVTCAPSACGCDDATGAWTCTEDCGGGGLCRTVSEGRCARNADCPRPTLCLGGRCEEVGCPAVYAPVCGVDGRTYGNTCEAEVARVRVAYAGECRQAPEGCVAPNPAGCTQSGCGVGETCVRDPEGCAPSACACDPDAGSWICTADCAGGGTCQILRDEAH